MRPVSFLMSPAKPLRTPSSPLTRHPISQTKIRPARLRPLFLISLPHYFVTSLLRLPISIPALTPLESALPQNQNSCFVTSIESTRFFGMLQICIKCASVTPAYTTLAEGTPRNPIRMNTSTKHQEATDATRKLTTLYSTSYQGIAVVHSSTREQHCSHHPHALSSSIPRRDACSPENLSPPSCSPRHSSLSPRNAPPPKPRQLRNSIPLSTPTSAGAASAPSAADAPWPSQVSIASPASSTWPRSTAASGRPTTSATPGTPSLTSNPPAPSAPSPSPPAIPTSFTSAAAKACNAPILLSATACTNLLTPAKPGRTLACATPSKSPRSSSTRTIPNASSFPSRAIPTAPAPNAACSAPSMAAQPSRKFSTRTKTPAQPIWPSIRRIRKSSTPFSGPRASLRGRFATAAPSSPRAAASSNPKTAATPGSDLPKACQTTRTTNSVAWASPSRTAIAIASTPPSRPQATRPAFTAPTISVLRGTRSITITASAAADRAPWASPSPPTIPTPSTLPTPPPGNPPTAERLSWASKALPAATTTSASGSAPTFPKSWLSPPIKARPSASTAARLGPVGTISPPRSSTTSPPTTNFLTGSTARSRKAAPRALPAAAITAKSPIATGSPSEWKNTATSLSIPSTTICSTAGASRAPISPSAKWRTSRRKFCAAANTATTAASRWSSRPSTSTRSIFPPTYYSKPRTPAAVGKSSARTFRVQVTRSPRISASSPPAIRRKENIAA